MKIIEIENKSGKVKLNDAIFKESVDKLLEEIGSVFSAKAVANGANFGEMMNCAENAADSIEFEIHSPGGSIMEGYRVYQAIQELRGRGVHVTAFINSLAASMGSVIAMAADEIKIVKGGRMMIHEASTSTWGNAADHLRNAKLLESMSEEIAGIYSERTGKPVSEMRDRMKEETWMSAEETVKEGFADEVVGLKLDGKNSLAIPTVEPKPADMTLFQSRADLKTKVEALESDIATLEAEASAASAELTTAQEEIKTLREQVAAGPTSEAITELQAKLTEAEAAAAPDKIEATALALVNEGKAEAVQLAIAGKVAEALAAEGHAPIESNPPGEAADKTILEKYEALSGPEKWAFLAKHAQEISEAAKKASK